MLTATRKEANLNSVFQEFINDTEDKVRFRYQASDRWTWIQENRSIFGQPWDWEFSDIPVDPGKADREHLELEKRKGHYFLKRAPRPYLKQYINDDAPIKSCIKCRQSEFTESEINTNLFYVSTHEYFNVRHLFPTAGVARTVAKEKITVAIETSERLKRRRMKPFNLTEKSFVGYSNYTVAGAFNEFGGRGPSSDRIVFDEFNSHNPKIKEVYNASTDHSRHGGQKVYISTPTFPNMGIDKEYQEGCQYKWFIRCPNKKCAHHNRTQEMIFPENIINFVEKGQARDKEEEEELLDEAYIGCRYCHAYINKTSDFYLKTGQWLAKFPKRAESHASYHVTGLMLAWATGKGLNRAYLNMRYENQFWNEKIGVSYLGDSRRVTKEDVEACQDYSFQNVFRRPESAKNVAAGIDWGDKESWICVVGDGLGATDEDRKKMRLLFAMRIANDTLAKFGFGLKSDDHPDLVMKVIDDFAVQCVINDANGIGIPHNSRLAKRYGSKSWGAFYDVTENKQENISRSSISISFQESRGVVTIPRTAELLETMDLFQKHKVPIPSITTPTMELFKEHLHSLSSTHYYDEDDDRIINIVGHIGPDHFAHAFTYARLAYERLRADIPPEAPKKKLRLNKGKR